jgi:lipid II:glycine glycyltransferase (peptidoglycan interpeptide bridge formation enzyme)
MIHAHPSARIPMPSRLGATDACPAQPLRVTWTPALAPDDAREYDAFLARAPGGHFAQSRLWSGVACAGRPFEACLVLVRDAGGAVVGAAQVLRARAGGLPLPYATIERGPVVAEPAALAGVLRAIARAARRRGIARLVVMPYWPAAAGALAALRAGGWRCIQTAAGAHAATLRLPLGGLAPDQLFAGSEHKKLRQEIRYAERAGARARRGSAADLPRFAALHRGLMQEQGLHAKRDAWFQALAALDFGAAGSVGLFFTDLPTDHGAETVAGALTVRHGRLVTLLLAASARAPQNPDKKLAKMVPCLVAAVEWARALGCDFDLGGVPIEGDADPKRLAIAQFKRDFARTRVELLGRHARWLLGPV